MELEPQWQVFLNSTLEFWVFPNFHDTVVVYNKKNGSMGNMFSIENIKTTTFI